MAEQRWVALADIVVGGNAVRAGETFTAPEELVGAVLGRLVAPARPPGKPRPHPKPKPRG